ncbi:MAG: hypothetical protein ACOC2F_06180, partial [Bacteroidota bacterium]
WYFASGNYITLPKQLYLVPDHNFYNDNFYEPTNVEAHYYGGINNYKTPDYHRLDVGINFSKTKPRGKRNLYLGFYNLYNQKNAYYYYIKKNGEKYNLMKFTLFPFIPTISYSCSF